MSTGISVSKDDFISTLLEECQKAHSEYDGSNRLQYLYEAPADAANGSPCLLTTFTYDGSSSRVVGMKESLGTWDSSWDI